MTQAKTDEQKAAEKAHAATQPPKGGRPADNAKPGPRGGAQHPVSKYERVPADELDSPQASPHSIVTREIRPDEQGADARGKTAFAANE